VDRSVRSGREGDDETAGPYAPMRPANPIAPLQLDALGSQLRVGGALASGPALVGALDSLRAEGVQVVTVDLERPARPAGRDGRYALSHPAAKRATLRLQSSFHLVHDVRLGSTTFLRL
jgi:hypothetical protein